MPYGYGFYMSAKKCFWKPVFPEQLLTSSASRSRTGFVANLGLISIDSSTEAVCLHSSMELSLTERFLGGPSPKSWTEHSMCDLGGKHFESSCFTSSQLGRGGALCNRKLDRKPLMEDVRLWRQQRQSRSFPRVRMSSCRLWTVASNTMIDQLSFA